MKQVFKVSVLGVKVVLSIDATTAAQTGKASVMRERVAQRKRVIQTNRGGCLEKKNWKSRSNTKAVVVKQGSTKAVAVKESNISMKLYVQEKVASVALAVAVSLGFAASFP